MVMNTVIFARGKDVRGQVEYCKRFAKAKGYNVVGVIVGGNYELKETIQGLQNDILIDLVLVRDMSRISRNALESYTIQADLEIECGVLIEVATDQPRDEITKKFMNKIIIEVRGKEIFTKLKGDIEVNE